MQVFIVLKKIHTFTFAFHSDCRFPCAVMLLKWSSWLQVVANCQIWRTLDVNLVQLAHNSHPSYTILPLNC